MNFLGFTFFFTPIVGFSFYKIFIRNYNNYHEQFTKNNYPNNRIKCMDKLKENPKNTKRVRFNSVVNVINI